MSELSDSDIVDAMQQYGGSFTSRLGALWRYADWENQARLKAAFLDVWEDYRKLAELKREQASR